MTNSEMREIKFEAFIADIVERIEKLEKLENKVAFMDTKIEYLSDKLHERKMQMQQWIDFNQVLSERLAKVESRVSNFTDAIECMKPDVFDEDKLTEKIAKEMVRQLKEKDKKNE